jgi:hypothetical protein
MDSGVSVIRRATVACAVAPIRGDQHLVGHTPQGVDIGAAVDIALSHRLLGAHVRIRADGDTRRSQPVTRCLRDCAGDAEIGHHRMARSEQNVFRLDVAVDHTLAVGKSQRIGGFPGDEQRVPERELLLPLEPLAERLA